MPPTEKVKWALYTKDHLNSLIADISRLITNLEIAFPAFPDSETRRQLCISELLEISDLEEVSQSLEVLRKAIEDRDLDPLLENVLTQTINENNEHRGNTTSDGGRMSNGNVGVASRNNRYIKNQSNGQGSMLVNGDTFGGRGRWG